MRACLRRWLDRLLSRLVLVAKLSDVSSVSLGASRLQLPALGSLVAPDPAVAALSNEVLVGTAFPGTTPSSGITVLALTFTAIFAFTFSSLAGLLGTSTHAECGLVCRRCRIAAEDPPRLRP